jgi:hypothetical protein
MIIKICLEGLDEGLGTLALLCFVYCCCSFSICHPFLPCNCCSSQIVMWRTSIELRIVQLESGFDQGRRRDCRTSRRIIPDVGGGRHRIRAPAVLRRSVMVIFLLKRIDARLGGEGRRRDGCRREVVLRRK